MLITAKFASRCTACKGQVVLGDRVHWEKGRKGVQHEECGAPAALEAPETTELEAGTQIAPTHVQDEASESYLRFCRNWNDAERPF